MKQLIHETKEEQHLTVLREANIIQAMYPYQQVFIICIGADEMHIDEVAISVDETKQRTMPLGVTLIYMTHDEFESLQERD